MSRLLQEESLDFSSNSNWSICDASFPAGNCLQYRREYTSEQSYRKSVSQYIQFYNELRPHRALKYKTPTGI
ncbi:transposase [Oscillibacter valericigenes]|nr:transposase [Oscillibacter valericigenes]